MLFDLSQICPDTTCGIAASAGGKWVFPAESAEKLNACAAFSVGVEGDGKKWATATACTNDYISIPGTLLWNKVNINAVHNYQAYLYIMFSDYRCISWVLSGD